MHYSLRFIVFAIPAIAFGSPASAQQDVDRHSSNAVVCGSSDAVVRGSADAAAAGSADIANPDPARFEAEIRIFEEWDRKNAFPRDGVLFVGSSSIRMWPTAENFPEVAAINRGFGGSHISDVNHFAERIVWKYAPRVIVFYAGDNDIEANKRPRQVFDDFRKFMRLAHKRLPEAKVVYLPIKPSTARWTKWPRMQEVNNCVERLAREDQRLIYLDTATPMLGADGRPRDELFLDDGLHLNANGYQGWTAALSGVLRQLVAMPNHARAPASHVSE